MDFVKPRYVSLKSHPTYRESWLHERILEDPSILGLGDLDVRDSERRQPGAGRLDLLLSDPESDTRYEVELQLGATDESHIIRTIEYWDVERKRYPQYEHVAVIVAEDVTNRFLNVIGLFNQAIPLIAIQIKAVEVKDFLTLVATQVLGRAALGTVEEEEGEPADRAFWERKASETSLGVCDEIVSMVNSITPEIQPKYNRHYIGLTGPDGVQNFVVMRPRKGEHVLVELKIPYSEDTDRSISESGLVQLPYDRRWSSFRVRIRKSDLDLDRSRAVVQDLIRQAYDHYTG